MCVDMCVCVVRERMRERDREIRYARAHVYGCGS